MQMQKLLFAILLFNFFPLFQISSSENIVIQSPRSGDELKGSVEIFASIEAQDLQYVEIDFRYQNSTSGNWFFIDRVQSKTVHGMITTWDTSLISDGDYQLRIIAYYENGVQEIVYLDNLHVRNYSFFEADSAEKPEVSTYPDSPKAELKEQENDLGNLVPVNELTVTTNQYFQTIGQGALVGILFVVVFSLLIVIRRRTTE